MTIEEAIKHCEEVAEEHERHLKVYENMDEDRPLFKEEENECKECANEHRQLAEWLCKYQKIEQIVNDELEDFHPLDRNPYKIALIKKVVEDENNN